MKDHCNNVNKKIWLLMISLLMTLVIAQPLCAGIYSIHVASYKTIGKAEIDKTRWSAKGYDAFVSQAHIPGKGNWYRVYAGRYDNRHEAEEAALLLKRAQKVEDLSVHYLNKMKKEPTVRETKSSSKHDSDSLSGNNRQKREEKKQKEAFNALLMGDRKLMPAPPKVIENETQEEETFREPNEKDITEPYLESDLYNNALNLMKEKKYTQALVTFKEFISREDTGKEWGQRALRHMADCHYWLGKEGSKQDLLIAAEFYKNTLESFPDPRKENALTYYRLAKTYEALKYYPEAVKQYQNLIIKYPNAPYVQEAYYKIGDIYYIDGKYNEAAEALIRFQMKYRGKVNAKQSFYMIAHAFYKGKQSTNAEVWFRDAKARWPNLSGLPKNLLMDLGLHKMSMRRFDEAISAFDVYVNLYPDDEKIRQVLMYLADAYQQAGQYSPALGIYNRLIEKYPDTKEAQESMLAMAFMGVERPGIKAFRFLENLQYYQNPMDTYDTLIMKNATGDVAEEAMLQKAAALVKKGQKRRAADVYLEFLRLHPESKRIVDASRGLKAASASLVDEYFTKKDYLAVAYVYFKSYGAVVLQADEYPEVSKIAFSLKELGFMDDYINLLNLYLRSTDNEAMINKISLDIAEGLVIQRKYDDAQQILKKLSVKPSLTKSGLMTGIKRQMAEIAYLKQQYDQAVVNYGAVVRAGVDVDDPGQFYSNYARSLKEQKENGQSLENFLTAIKYLDKEKNEKLNAGIVYKEAGDLYLKSNNLASGLYMYHKALDSVKDPEMKLWSQFLVGKTYLKMNRDEQAQNTFSQIKAESGTEGFWSRVVDFYVSDYKWWNKYGESVKK